jgi:LmbE family N-acetylglucosaminyl deacetylase
LGRIREQELYASAKVLGLQEVKFLDYLDGELDQADPIEAIGKIVSHLRRVRPHVVVTFDPNGAYGHPDHIAISQLTTAAIVAAADSTHNGLATGVPHRVSKLYYRSFRAAEAAAYQAAFGDLMMRVGGEERRFVAWPDWAITTRVDTSAYWSQVWEAVACHRSQLPGYQVLRTLPEEHHQNLWSIQTYYRAYSLVNTGREVEPDLFVGIREAADTSKELSETIDTSGKW